MVCDLPEDGTDVVPVHNIKAYRGSRDTASQPTALPWAYRKVADIQEPPYSWFQPFVIAHFNTTVLTLSAQFQWVRIRSHGRWVSSPDVLILHISLSTQSSSHFLCGSLPTFMLYGMRLSLKHIHYFMLPKSVSVLLTINLFCLFSCYLIFLLTLFCKFLKPNRCTTIKTESCVCESLSVPIQSWTTSLLYFRMYLKGSSLNCAVDRWLPQTGHFAGSSKQKTLELQCWKHRIPGSVSIREC